jgi:flagellar basal body rod protein FlgG
MAAGLGEPAASDAVDASLGRAGLTELKGELPMQNALLVGLSRQVALAREMDVIANNLANMNTSGFKADGAVFEEFVSPTARADNFLAADRRISFVHDHATWMDLSQGPLERTGNPLDVAINGKGYLAVQTPRGERYTRNGALQINNSGELVTAEGFQVMGESGPITFQPKDRNITISQDGTISGARGQQQPDGIATRAITRCQLRINLAGCRKTAPGFSSHQRASHPNPINCRASCRVRSRNRTFDRSSK